VARKSPVILWRVEAPHFCASFDTVDGIVTEAAPIIKWMMGKSYDEVLSYATRKLWTIRYVESYYDN